MSIEKEYTELFDAVFDINCRINSGEDYSKFFLNTIYDGFTCKITFLGETIYHSENDEREWDDKNDCRAMSIKDHLNEKVSELLKEVEKHFPWSF